MIALPASKYSCGKWILRNTDEEAARCDTRREIAHLIMAARGLREQRGTPASCITLARLIADQTGEVEFYDWCFGFVN